MRGRNGLVAQHGKAILEIAFVSVLGIVASAGFQIAAARGLGPGSFGLLASFLALINVAAIGSSALRNSVAVTTAELVTSPRASAPMKGRFDSSAIEAVVLGGTLTVGILIFSPWLASSLETNMTALVLTACTVTPYFFFSRAQGLLQGAGDARSVVWWSTGAQVAQLVLSLVALLLGYGAVGIIAVLLITAVAGTVGSTFQARTLVVRSGRRPFSLNSSVVLLLTITFAWLTSVDVILVRSGTSETVAGSYAAAAVLVKTTLIIPATLSLYLLPRFVSRRQDSSITKFGVNATLAITFLSGLAMLTLVFLAGGPTISILFGAGYQFSAQLLPGLALMWLPWAMAQGILIRLTASSSKLGLVVLVISAIIQWIGSTALLPDVVAMMVLNGTLGIVTLVVLFGIHLAAARPTSGDN